MTTDLPPPVPGTDIRVRPARSHDLNEVVALWSGCGLVPPQQGFRNELTYKLLRDPGLALVAERDSGIIGAVVGGYDGRAASVSRLGVRADARRQGIARRLVSELLRRLEGIGAPTDDLVVLDDSAEGRAFWEGLGFTQTSGVARYTRPRLTAGGPARSSSWRVTVDQPIEARDE